MKWGVLRTNRARDKGQESINPTYRGVGKQKTAMNQYQNDHCCLPKQRYQWSLRIEPKILA